MVRFKVFTKETPSLKREVQSLLLCVTASSVTASREGQNAPLATVTHWSITLIVPLTFFSLKGEKLLHYALCNTSPCVWNEIRIHQANHLLFLGQAYYPADSRVKYKSRRKLQPFLPLLLSHIPNVR